MLPLFCLRLSLGLLTALFLLSPATIHPRLYRTHLLTVLGLCSLALASILSDNFAVPLPILFTLGLALLGVFVWSVEGAPGGRLLLLMTMIPLAIELCFVTSSSWRPPSSLGEKQSGAWGFADDLTSSALVGFALTAMLLGHSYLINPSMTLQPLKRLLIGLYVCLLARSIVAALSLGLWSAALARLRLTDVTLMWLPMRWGLGLIVPAVLGFLAWRTTLLRNTQSSTGILYIVVVFVCIGELMAQLLFNVTGYFL